MRHVCVCRGCRWVAKYRDIGAGPRDPPFCCRPCTDKRPFPPGNQDYIMYFENDPGNFLVNFPDAEKWWDGFTEYGPDTVVPSWCRRKARHKAVDALGEL